jgi:hypothetical protein
MKTIPSKLWSVASGNQTVSGGGGGDGGGVRDQNQSIPDFVRGYNNGSGGVRDQNQSIPVFVRGYNNLILIVIYMYII